MTARIIALGLASPPAVPMNEVAALLADGPGGADVARIVGGGAVHTKGMAVNPMVEDPRSWSTARRMARSLSEARALGREAVSEALRRAGIRADDVGLFATVTTTTHSAPGLDLLASELGMAADTHVLSLGPMGCYAALPGVSAGRDWVEVHRRYAVVLCVDLFSPHLQPGPYDKEAAVIASLFGDGAAAAVIAPAESGHPGLDVVDNEMLTAPAHADDLQVHIGDQGLGIVLAPTMPGAVASSIAKPVDTLLARNGLRRDDVDYWAVHPGGLRIIDRVADELNLPTPAVESSKAVLAERGNTASAAVLTVLHDIQQATPLEPGRHAVAMAFGPGATIATMLLRGANAGEPS
jgi:predicted naringenin-chalcone synthase